jgi:hypothetical protein
LHGRDWVRKESKQAEIDNHPGGRGGVEQGQADARSAARQRLEIVRKTKSERLREDVHDVAPASAGGGKSQGRDAPKALSLSGTDKAWNLGRASFYAGWPLSDPVCKGDRRGVLKYAGLRGEDEELGGTVADFICFAHDWNLIFLDGIHAPAQLIQREE